MKYPFEAYLMKVEDHIFWVAESLVLKGCVAQGESSDEAIKVLQENEIEWLKSACGYGLSTPTVPIQSL